MACKGGYAVREGQWVEIIHKPTGELLASFKAKSSMCKSIFNRYLVLYCNVPVNKLDYVIKVIKG